MNRKERLISAVIYNEGGYVNHPRDTGGETVFGITKRWFPEDFGRVMDAIKNKRNPLPLVHEFYEKNFYSELFDALVSDEVAYFVFDWRVNAGTKSIELIKKALNKKYGSRFVVNSVLDMRLIEALNARTVESEETLLKTLREARLEHLRRLNNWDVFGKGWTLRVNRTLKGIMQKLSGGFQNKG